jgi:molecular chaperone GrpE
MRNEMTGDMDDKNMPDSDDRIEIEVTEPTPIPPGTKFEDGVEVGEDFSSDLDPVEEEVQLVEEPNPQARIAELEDRLLRAAAEFDNYRKRTARQFEEITRSANDRLLTELLEVVDNFDRARQHADEKVDAASLKQGMDQIHNQLVTLLAKNDVKPIEALGKPFDPQLHDAMMQIESAEYPEGIVALEMARGYQQGTRVIRHSKVGVSKGKPK